MQMWALNPERVSPDEPVLPGQTLNIGHLYELRQTDKYNAFLVKRAGVWGLERNASEQPLHRAVEHLEAKVLGDSAIQAAERIRVVELLDLVDLAVLPPTEEGGGVLALAIDAAVRTTLYCFLELNTALATCSE